MEVKKLFITESSALKFLLFQQQIVMTFFGLLEKSV